MLKSLRPFITSLLFAALLTCSAALAQKQAVPPQQSIPSRIILTWAGDPATTQAVSWRTETPLQSPQAQIAKLDANPAFEKTAKTVAGIAATDDLGNGKTAGHYAIKFDGLEPGTKYCYRVGDGKAWSEWNVFLTASAKADPFHFIYVGDAQNSIRSLWSRTIRSAFAAAPDARFIVHAGDLVAEGYDDRLWGEWCDALEFISAWIPSLPVPGNHDLHRPPTAPDAKLVLSASPLWARHFVLPANGPEAEELRSQSYFLDYQGVRFVALDVNAFANESFEPGARKSIQEKELAWLEKVLGENRNRWTIVVQHQTIYSVAKEREYSEMRAALVPIYEKHHVDLVLQGHDHAYARTHKISGGRVVAASAPGVIYVISVSGPKMYDFDNTFEKLMARMVGQKQFYQIVDVSQDRMQFTAYSVDGGIEDRFILEKNGTGTTYTNIAAK